MAPGKPIYQLKVTLRGSRPPIWRRILVLGDITLYQLHRIIQVVMAWTESHLHQFRRGNIDYGASDPEFGVKRQNERRVRPYEVLQKPKDRMGYEYDFGDGWEHDVLLEEICSPRRAARYPQVLAGKRACPPEDVGGIGG